MIRFEFDVVDQNLDILKLIETGGLVWIQQKPTRFSFGCWSSQIDWVIVSEYSLSLSLSF